MHFSILVRLFSVVERMTFATVLFRMKQDFIVQIDMIYHILDVEQLT